MDIGQDKSQHPHTKSFVQLQSAQPEAFQIEQAQEPKYSFLIRAIRKYRSLQKYVLERERKISLYATVISTIVFVRNYLSFESELHCPYDNYDQCVYKHFMPYANNQWNWKPKFIADCVVFTLLLHFLVRGKIHRAIPFLSLTLFASLFFFGSHQMSQLYMIGLLKLGHIITCIGLVVGYALLWFFFVCLSRKAKKIWLGSILSVYLIMYVVFNYTSWNCDDWGDGINGKMEDEEGLCRYKVPNCHFLKILPYLSYDFIGHNCFLGDKYKKIYDEFFYRDISNGTIVAFDDFKNTTDIQKEYQNLVQGIYSRARRYKTIQQANNQTKKYDVLFDTSTQNYYIDIKRNETLVKERRQRWEKYQKGDSPALTKNVLVIYLDSVSRNELTLKMPMLYDWFKTRTKYHNYRKQQPEQNKKTIRNESFYFYRFLSVGLATRYNSFPLSYGSPEFIEYYDLFDNKRGMAVDYNITANSQIYPFPYYYKERGFITGHSHTYCSMYHTQMFKSHIERFIFAQYDHQTVSYSCDPNFFTQMDYFSYIRGNAASTDRCLYHKRIAEYEIEHATSFFEKYKDESKFYMMSYIEGHNWLAGTIKYIDPDIVGFLNKLESQGVLDDTTVILLSDHGQHLGNGQSVYSDKMNPLLLVHLPENVNKKYRERIRYNQQNTISLYNFHHFLRHLAEGQGYEKKQFGLFGDLTSQKSCEDVLVYPPEICFCN